MGLICLLTKLKWIFLISPAFPFQCSLMHWHWDDRGFWHHYNPFCTQLLFQVLQSFWPPHSPALHTGSKVGGNLPPHTYLQKPEALSWYTFSSSWSAFSQAVGLTALLHKKTVPWKKTSSLLFYNKLCFVKICEWSRQTVYNSSCTEAFQQEHTNPNHYTADVFWSSKVEEERWLWNEEPRGGGV